MNADVVKLGNVVQMTWKFRDLVTNQIMQGMKTKFILSLSSHSVHHLYCTSFAQVSAKFFLFSKSHYLELNYNRKYLLNAYHLPIPVESVLHEESNLFPNFIIHIGFLFLFQESHP